MPGFTLKYRLWMVDGFIDDNDLKRQWWWFLSTIVQVLGLMTLARKKRLYLEFVSFPFHNHLFYFFLCFAAGPGLN